MGNNRLKAAAKKFANKFATGASVSKNNQNQDEIIVQGDVSDEIFDFITEDKFFKTVPEDNIDCIEGNSVQNHTNIILTNYRKAQVGQVIVSIPKTSGLALARVVPPV